MSLKLTSATKRRDYGDFQTPPALVAEILDLLETIGDRPQRVLEPTCGEGRFIAELLDRPHRPTEIRGFDIQPRHAEIARSLVDPAGRCTVVVEMADLFAIELRSRLNWSGTGPLLVVGNLPWVTTSSLGVTGGQNGPTRQNHRRRRGIDAMTGESNFDISEAIWYKLIRELALERPTIALLCKTAVARAVLREIDSAELPVTKATIWRVDARRWFGASVDACLLRVEVGPGEVAAEAEVFAELSATKPESTLGFAGGRLFADLDAYRRVAFADVGGPLQWRQGVKHDATAIMELTMQANGTLFNKLGDIVDVEEDYVFPLFKGTDLAAPSASRPSRQVIVTQSRLGEDTNSLAEAAPRLWAYLNNHRHVFEHRKSSIYRGRSAFAMFGVGDYSFAPFKVAISGLHKASRFRMVESVGGRPTMLDDTCYFLPCRTLEQARLLEQTLNGAESLELLRALVFRDAKRPVTKALLQRIGIKTLLERAGMLDQWQQEWESDWTKSAQSTAMI